MRVSDTERQRVIDELRRHCAAGRLGVDEYATRIESAMDATTLEQLDLLLTDLPLMRIADPAGAGRNGSFAGSIGRGGRPSLSAGGRSDGVGAGGLTRRVGASAVVLLTVVLVLIAVGFAVAVDWTWIAILVVGWLIGLVQGRISKRRG